METRPLTRETVATATREELADELAAAGGYTEDWQYALIGDLRARVLRQLAESDAIDSTMSAGLLIDESVREDRRVSYTAGTQIEYEDLYDSLLAECDDDCEVTTEDGGTIFWGVTDSGTWKVQLFPANEEDTWSLS